jgi:probable addiction module antidote protein|tara:strand:- start:103 stop:396 length:294 start_codon:yes stop_codon:yes gene_type:complete
MTELFSHYDSADYLSTKDDMQGYLDSCLAQDAGDGRLIQAALGDIARAQNMSQLARDVGISREGLYKALSADGNPSFGTMLKVSKVLGLSFRISVAT